MVSGLEVVGLLPRLGKLLPVHRRKPCEKILTRARKHACYESNHIDHSLSHLSANHATQEPTASHRTLREMS